MNNSLQLFNFEGQDVRAVWNDEKQDWRYIAADACNILDHSDVSMACARLDEDEKGTSIVCTLGGNQKMLSVTESGLYHLIFTSRKEEAKAFRKWVTSEVLPSIRKTGGYMGNEEELLKSQLGMMQFAQNVVQKIVDAVSKRWILDNPKRAPYAYIMLCYMRTLFHHAARSYEGAIELMHGKECIPAIKGDVVKLVADIQNGKSTIQLQFPFDNDQ